MQVLAGPVVRERAGATRCLEVAAGTGPKDCHPLLFVPDLLDIGVGTVPVSTYPPRVLSGWCPTPGTRGRW